jgi:DNA polymerase III delta prime subunit
MKNIIESVKLYPRGYLFIKNNKNQCTDEGLQQILYAIVPDTNIGINDLRSIDTSHYLTKLH